MDNKIKLQKISQSVQTICDAVDRLARELNGFDSPGNGKTSNKNVSSFTKSASSTSHNSKKRNYQKVTISNSQLTSTDLQHRDISSEFPPSPTSPRTTKFSSARSPLPSNMPKSTSPIGSKETDYLKQFQTHREYRSNLQDPNPPRPNTSMPNRPIETNAVGQSFNKLPDNHATNRRHNFDIDQNIKNYYTSAVPDPQLQSTFSPYNTVSSPYTPRLETPGKTKVSSLPPQNYTPPSTQFHASIPPPTQTYLPPRSQKIDLVNPYHSNIEYSTLQDSYMSLKTMGAHFSRPYQEGLNRELPNAQESNLPLKTMGAPVSIPNRTRQAANKHPDDEEDDESDEQKSDEELDVNQELKTVRPYDSYAPHSCEGLSYNVPYSTGIKVGNMTIGSRYSNENRTYDLKKAKENSKRHPSRTRGIPQPTDLSGIQGSYHPVRSYNADPNISNQFPENNIPGYQRGYNAPENLGLNSPRIPYQALESNTSESLGVLPKSVGTPNQELYQSPGIHSQNNPSLTQRPTQHYKFPPTPERYPTEKYHVPLPVDMRNVYKDTRSREQNYLPTEKSPYLQIQTRPQSANEVLKPRIAQLTQDVEDLRVRFEKTFEDIERML